MSGVKNRAYLQSSGQYYLCPLSEVQCSKKELKRYLGLEKESERRVDRER